jgi:hypothetical protein
LIVGVEADSAFNVPDGNDLQIARVFWEWYLNVFQKGTPAYWSWSDGVKPTSSHMCGNLRQSNELGFVVVFSF